ncbi:MAG: hypothetical protein IPL71_01905 [Anaerolineales bacterium]|uniref:hypothetical protein n=1 Tax=Candidatus Villigracilis proximus TaxID=3140683 RepID=UPI0031366B91|nr:hypothetical protein [Anaerolineales bacterium]
MHKKIISKKAGKMEKKQNTLFLLKQWIPIIIIWGILLFGMFGLIRQGSYMPIPVIAIAGMVILWTYTGTTAQFNKLLKSSSPQPLIDYYDKKIGKAKTPHKDANLVFTKALAYTLYGYFDSARTEAGKINWEKKPPLFQAQKIYLLALWAYLEKHDFRQGINLAKEARRLTEVSKSFPGANVSLILVI